MSVSKVVLSIVACLALSPKLQAQSLTPHDFVARYAVSYRGMSAGTLIFSFQRDAASGHYIYETRAEPSFLASFLVSTQARERSEMEILDSGVRPLHWSLDDAKSGNKNDGDMVFDWTKQVASGISKGEKFEVPVTPGVQDRLSIQIAVATSLMRGQEPGTITIIDETKVKDYSYRRTGTGTANSDQGQLDSVLYESTRGNSSRISKFWLLPKYEFAAVRAEQLRKGKVETVMELKSLEIDGTKVTLK
jgi:Protein of unknown function (DUF3108)